MQKRSADKLHIAKNTGDFIVRGHNYMAMHSLVIALCVIMIGLSAALFFTEKLTITSTLFIVIGMLCGYVAVHITRSHRLLNATEFQNAMFASALAMGSAFCMILTREGGLVYFDRLFQGMFPDFMKQPARSLDALLDLCRVSANEKEKIKSAISNGAYEKVPVELHGNGGVQKMVLLIEPILRPSGYVLLRAYDPAHPSTR